MVVESVADRAYETSCIQTPTLLGFQRNLCCENMHGWFCMLIFNLKFQIIIVQFKRYLKKMLCFVLWNSIPAYNVSQICSDNVHVHHKKSP